MAVLLIAAGRAATVVGALLGIMVIGSLGWLGCRSIWVMVSCRFVFNWSEQRRRNALYAQFPDALAMIVRAVRVGIPLAEGIRTWRARRRRRPRSNSRCSTTGSADRHDAGRRAVARWPTRNDLREYRFFATALALQSQTGGGLSETLEGLADVIRSARAARRAAMRWRRRRTPRLILASLPFVSGGALACSNPSYMSRGCSPTRSGEQ